MLPLAVAPIAIVTCAVPLVLVIGSWRAHWAAPTTLVAAALTSIALLYGWQGNGHMFTTAWVPSLELHLTLLDDALALVYGLVASGIGVLVIWFSAAYLPHHLHSKRRQPDAQVAYYVWLLVFMGSMLGLALAADLILLFVFFDLTAVCSYFLIAFDRDANAQAAALSALLVTGITSVAMLVGMLLLYADYGTFSIPELIERARPGAALTTALALIALAALAKSAQFPLHFWLPRAMAAPAPVSAYLHSAAMVAAGVFVLHRLHPLLELTPALRTVLLAIALLSILVGSLLAIHADDSKRILAYSTIAQYGYVTLLLSLGGATAAAAAAFYVLVHALCKSALFLLAGAVETASGERSLHKLGGLARRQPLLAISGAVAAATLAGLPLSAGFFKDELFFKLALQHSLWLGLAATAAAALTLTYSWRFWSGIFLGPETHATARSVSLSWHLQLPIALLAVLCLLGGVYAAPAIELANDAGQQLYRTAVALETAYHFSLTSGNLMALGAYVGATALWLSRRYWQAALATLVESTERCGPDLLYRRSQAWLARAGDWLHQMEVHDLRDRIAGVLLPAGVLVAAALIASFDTGIGMTDFQISAVLDLDAKLTPQLLLIIMLLLAAGSGLLVVYQHEHLALILSLTGLGFSLAFVYALLGAPDVALVAVLMETVLTLLLLATLVLLPQQTLQRQREREAARHTTRWHTLAGVVAGGLIFVLSWIVLSEPVSDSVAGRYLELSQQAHAGNVVAAILADFRGLDTLGEATVIFVALLGIVTLLRRESGQQREQQS